MDIVRPPAGPCGPPGAGPPYWPKYSLLGGAPVMVGSLPPPWGPAGPIGPPPMRMLARIIPGGPDDMRGLAPICGDMGGPPAPPGRIGPGYCTPSLVRRAAFREFCRLARYDFCDEVAVPRVGITGVVSNPPADILLVIDIVRPPLAGPGVPGVPGVGPIVGYLSRSRSSDSSFMDSSGVRSPPSRPPPPSSS